MEAKQHEKVLSSPGKVSGYFKDYFPYSTYREGQEEAIEKIAKAFSKGYKYVVLDAPTGAGKSAINTAFARGFEKSFYTTPQNSLVDQIEADDKLKGHYESLKGKSHYECQNTDCKEFSQGQHTAEECENNIDNEGTKDKICCDARFVHDFRNPDADKSTFKTRDQLVTELYSDTTCDYPRELWEALNSSNMLTNTFLFSISPFLNKRDLAIIDESHNLEDVIFNFVEISLTSRKVPFYKEIKEDLPTENPKELEEFIVNDLRDICDNKLKQLEESETSGGARSVKETEADMNDQDVEQREKELKEEKDEIRELMDKIDRIDDLDEEFVVEQKDETDSVDGVILKPVYCGDFFQNKIAPKADYFLLSSATFTNAKKSLEKLDVPKTDVKVVSLGSNFPENKRPVYFEDVTDLRSTKKDEGDLKDIAEKVLQIMSRYQNKKGIIHCVSYKRQGEIKQILEELGGGSRIIAHGRNDSDEKLEEFKKKDDNSVFLSVSKEEGVDLKDDQARFNILVKMPNPYMDERVQHRVFKKGEWPWYFTKTAVSTAQAYGRTTRSKNDWSDFYILDSHFKEIFLRNEEKFPPWFRSVVDIKKEEKER